MNPALSASPSRPAALGAAGRVSVAARCAIILAAQVAATVVAIAADWRTASDHGAAGRPVSSAFAAHGSAISAPIVALVLLVAGALLSRGRGRWASAGVAAVGVVALLFAWGAVGEVASSPSRYASRGLLVFSCVFGLAQSAWLLDGVRRRIRRRPVGGAVG